MNTSEFVSQIYCAKNKKDLIVEPNFEEGNGLSETEALAWPQQ
jgi:hypothetical protein